MNTEFRVWDINGRMMYYPDLISISRDGTISINNTLNFRPHECVLQKSTSHRDYNRDYKGHVIFEGDIVKQKINGKLFVVKFGIIKREVMSYYEKIEVEIEGFYYENLHTKFPALLITKNKYGNHDKETVEIVGNIFEDNFNEYEITF